MIISKYHNKITDSEVVVISDKNDDVMWIFIVCANGKERHNEFEYCVERFIISRCDIKHVKKNNGRTNIGPCGLCFTRTPSFVICRNWCDLRML